jgi:hypothetical protein
MCRASHDLAACPIFFDIVYIRLEKQGVTKLLRQATSITYEEEKYSLRKY